MKVMMNKNTKSSNNLNLIHCNKNKFRSPYLIMIC